MNLPTRFPDVFTTARLKKNEKYVETDDWETITYRSEHGGGGSAWLLGGNEITENATLFGFIGAD
jgi:hypothetical protein